MRIASEPRRSIFKCFCQLKRKEMKKRNDIRTPQPPLGGVMGLMRPIRSIGLIGLICLIVLMGLWSCSKEQVEVRRTASVELMSYARIFTDEDPDTRGETRRTGWAPDGYLPYNKLTGADIIEMTNENAAIGVFFTKDLPTTTQEQRKFRYGSDETWRMNEDLEGGGDYYLYGYVPLDAATVSIAPDAETGNYADGARLTFSGLSSVMSKDICVLVGAKEGRTAELTDTYTEVTVTVGVTIVTGLYTRSGEVEPYTYTEIITPNTKAAAETTYYRKDDLAIGKFGVHINVGEDEDIHNYLFLLFDHIYSALSFQFKISETYYTLRTIKVKKLELRAYSDETCTTPMKKYQTMTIALKAKTDGSTPLPSSFTFTPDESSGDIGYVLIYENAENPVELTPNRYSDMIGFVPRNANYFILRSTYDVYDRAGNLVRKDCTAENRINLRTLFNQDYLEYGHRYIVKLLVEPTYLYQLSEPDLDNPVIKLTGNS